MESTDGLRIVRLQGGQIIDINELPVEIPVETGETTEDCVDGHPIISLQSLPRADSQDLILHSQEDIIVDVGDSEVYSAYSMDVPHQELLETGPSTSKRSRKKRLGKVKIEHDNESELSYEIERCARRWEQKQVQIKTLEGEFSVTMWASGTDDGKCFIFKRIFFFKNFVFPCYLCMYLYECYKV